MSAGQDIDRIDLDESDAIDQPAQVPAIDMADSRPVGQPLGGDGDPTRGRGREAGRL